MEIAFTIVLIIYGGLLLQAKRIWDSIPETVEMQSDYPGVTVVIPVRNEEKNINTLIASLDEVEYPKDKLEIVIVDDASQDRTLELVRSAASKRSNYRYFTLEEPVGFSGSYKKRALTTAIESAKHPIIVTSDADCQFHHGWLYALLNTMQKNNLVMVTAPVAYFTRNWSAPFLDIEFASLVALGAASLHTGLPNMCNGANLAFTKEAFTMVNGYQGFEKVVSGDDEFLLYKVFNRYPSQVSFAKNAKAIVSTEPPSNWVELINQRKRWSGKWKAHKSKTTRALALFIFIFHLTFIVSFILVGFGIYSWEILILQIAFKATLEYIFVNPVLKFLGKKISIPWFIFMQLLYSFYAIFIGMLVQFTGFSWKNRRYR